MILNTTKPALKRAAQERHADALRMILACVMLARRSGAEFNLERCEELCREALGEPRVVIPGDPFANDEDS